MRTAALFLAAALTAIPALAETGSWTFADGPRGWTPAGKARVTAVSHRPGGASLCIAQAADADQESAWHSPPLKSDGRPVRVTFWAADNYTVQPDSSYSAAVGLSVAGADGQFAAPPSWKSIPWDDGRKEPWWGPLSPRALQWTYHEAVFGTPPAGGTFRISFFWPKAMARGECHLSGVRVLAEAADAAPASSSGPAASGAAAFPLRLEITTPAGGQLFFADDPLRFECLLFDPAGKPVEGLAGPALEYDITDYDRFHVASGAVSFAAAEPFAGPKKAGADRSRALRLTLKPDLPATREPGREFFFHAVLKDGGRVLAEDTIPYGVVDPKPAPTGALDRCLFVHFDGEDRLPVDTGSRHEAQSLRAKMGVSYIHDWDYGGWKKAQPVFPGPLQVQARPSSFPKVIYCPNLEQIRGRKPGHPWGDVSSMAPQGASFDDPLRPGCKAFDIDGYVAYIVESVRTNRANVALVVPSGLERPIDARTLELQRKAYTALKREFPDLPVGMMLYGLFMNPAPSVDLFLKEKLYEHADFIDDHMYQPSMDFTEWKRLRAETLKRSGKTLYFLSTEFSRVGGRDQIERSRGMITSHLEAWASGMRWITYFNVKQPVPELALRGEVPGDGFAWMQTVPRPAVSADIRSDRKPENSLMPLLQCLTYHNLVRNFEAAEYKTSFKPGPASVAHVFVRDGRTVCALYLNRPVPPETLAVRTDVPFVCQDMMGRTERLEPAGAALVSATENPAVLLFDREVPALHDPALAPSVLAACEGALAPVTVPRGSAFTWKTALPPVFSNRFTATVSGTVDGRWPETRPVRVKVQPGKAAEVELALRVAAGTPVGGYPLSVRVHDGARLVGAIKVPLAVDDLLSLRLEGVPETASRRMALAVTVRNLSDRPKAGVVEVDNRLFGGAHAPAAMAGRYAVPAGGETVVTFEAPPDHPRPAGAAVASVRARDDSGLAVAASDEVLFASRRAAGPIAVDGDLADWNLAALRPVPLERYHTAWGKRFSGPADLDATAYSRWDDRRLYFAVEVADDSALVRTNTLDIWQDDNIMLGLYPWGWRLGQPLAAGYYREHLGPCSDGQARVFRIGNPPGGPGSAEGVDVAVKRTGNGYSYEWAYPRESLAPLALEPGARFRLSLTVCDRDWEAEGKAGPLGGIQLGGFNLSVDAQPTKWREFVLTAD